MASQEEIARGAKSNGRKAKRSRLSTAFDVPDERGEVVTWEAANPQGVAALTVQVSSLGGAITFGGSRDGGALQITVFLDGDKFTRWIPAATGIDQVIAEIWEKLETLK